MNWKRHLYSAAAFVVGFSIAGTAAMSQTAWDKVSAVTEILLPRQQEGREIAKGDTVFATYDTELQDLPPLVPETTEVGRYQTIALEGAAKDFVVLDTRLGIARRYTEEGTVLVYSARVPNHAIVQTVRKHDAFESTTRREIRTKQP